MVAVAVHVYWSPETAFWPYSAIFALFLKQEGSIIYVAPHDAFCHVATDEYMVKTPPLSLIPICSLGSIASNGITRHLHHTVASNAGQTLVVTIVIEIACHYYPCLRADGTKRVYGRTEPFGHKHTIWLRQMLAACTAW